MSHTKGPWTTDNVTSEFSHDIILGYDVPNAGYPILVAAAFFDEVEVGPGSISSREAEANARLIAAAPELLDALRELVRIDSEYFVPDSDINAAREQARAAIAKATGKE